MSEWNAMTYEGKDTILRVVRREADQMFELAGEPGAWDAPTACESWRVKDVIGHIVDTTEGYFRAFETARSGADAPSPHGMVVPHAYMGPVPAFVYAGGQLMDYGVHTWDIRQGSGRAHALPADTADLLVPFMFIIWQSTIRPDADLSPFSIGIRVSGRNAGETRVSISDAGMSYEPGKIDDLPAILEFDPGSLVLTAFGRINGGTASADPALADRFLNLFYRI